MSHIYLQLAKLTGRGRYFKRKLETWLILIRRIVLNPDKRPYNISEVILWSLDEDVSTASSSHLELDIDNEECYYFERLERVLATQVITIEDFINICSCC